MNRVHSQIVGSGLVKVWMDGALLEEADAHVSPFDHGLLTGDGVFETMRVYGGRPFALRRHLDRLGRSARGLGLPCPDRAALAAAVGAVVAANGLVEARVRITMTGGPAPLGSERGTARPTMVVAAGPLTPWPATADGVVVPWPRNERGALAGLKTTSYAENVVALGYAREQGAGEAVFGNCAGNLCEGTGTNVFLAVRGRLVTPPLSAGCLAGVTRDLLVEAEVAVEEDVAVGTLAEAEEAFLTSTTREIQPIRAVDGRALPACPGPHTEAARTAFAAVLARTFDP